MRRLWRADMRASPLQAWGLLWSVYLTVGCAWMIRSHGRRRPSRHWPHILVRLAHPERLGDPAVQGGARPRC
ncbi:hypothetical protein C8F01DRAFT_1128168 [Mycena amicta]|nr:hypothetical protein C8F01DRAFT_1128168 [Mycena amicta]